MHKHPGDITLIEVESQTGLENHKTHNSYLSILWISIHISTFMCLRCQMHVRLGYNIIDVGVAESLFCICMYIVSVHAVSL